MSAGGGWSPRDSMHAGCSLRFGGMTPWRALLTFGVMLLAEVRADTCPGDFHMPGYGKVSLVPTGWGADEAPSATEVREGRILVPHMGARAYFADTCTAGVYNRNDYIGLNLLGKTLRFTTDMSNSGCGCNAALYLVSMKQNPEKSDCHDYYCDANNVCGCSCSEIDIQEANQHAWHSTLHSSQDHSGLGKGYGGGDGWNGPRDFNSQQYGPGAECIDTNKPFQVAAAFPIDGAGNMVAMEVTLSQEGKSCPLKMRINGYKGMAELTKAMNAGMTPVMSYWSDDTMTWMDGKGSDGQGPCAKDDASKCTETVQFYDLSVEEIGDAAPPLAPGPKRIAAARKSPTPEPIVVPKIEDTCPGSFQMPGYGEVSLVPTGWGGPHSKTEVKNGRALVPHMGARAYFADTCNVGVYNRHDYVGLNLLGKTLKFTTHMADSGCGCNAALYLVSMKQNPDKSDCHDYYCDANNVCGCSCAEIDLQEANMHAWHSTLHTSQDHSGLGKGYGGGDGWNGPRDFNSKQYGPGAECIDTNKPFQVAASFPVDGSGTMVAMEVTLSQKGKSCPLTMRVDGYKGMDELTRAMRAGMTPVMSYWSDDTMTWMDGVGTDGQGPCERDDSSKCTESVEFYDFSVEELKSSPAPAPKTTKKPEEEGNPWWHPEKTKQTTTANAEATNPWWESDKTTTKEEGNPWWHPKRTKRTTTTKPPTTTPYDTSLDTCPGVFDMPGYGPVSLVPTGWGAPHSKVEVQDDRILVPHMDSRAYFADACIVGTYNRHDYAGLNLLGKTLKWTTDMSGSGCGCNAAFYLVSMRQNPDESDCHDYYCDANNVCGCSCSEVDLQEANMHAWHSTLHSSHDKGGLGKGYGGGNGWNGPRDFNSKQYGPGAECIDTDKPFQVAASFPVDGSGNMVAMEVVLSQEGKDCPLTMKVEGYKGNAELTKAMTAGMTPVMSYWSDDTMTWMDGKGADGQGPCAKDDASKCSESVKFYDFAIEKMPETTTPKPTEAQANPWWQPAKAEEDTTTAKPVTEDTCPGSFHMAGYGEVSLVPTGWGGPHSETEVVGGQLVPHMGARAYFADICIAGDYNNKYYIGLDLLGKTLKYTTHMADSGCGCNAALYLVSMRQNPDKSDCHDYYCDANNVCGCSCAEIDLQEANQHAWHSTLHTSSDKSGMGKGYGGGDGWNGPRDFNSKQYGPGAECIDTDKPFQVAASFPVDGSGNMVAMEVVLSQEGKDCPLVMRVDEYKGLAELTKAMSAGMTPVMSYWSDNTMTWMDGVGSDGQGPCPKDDASKCTETVKFYDFSIEQYTPPPSGSGTQQPTVVTDAEEESKPEVACVQIMQDCRSAPCCDGAQCVKKNDWWSQCEDKKAPTEVEEHHRHRKVVASIQDQAGQAEANDNCPGDFDMSGYGRISLVSAKWNIANQPAASVELDGGNGQPAVVPHLTGRAYFGNTCTPGSYDNHQYVALNLLGKSFRYTTDMAGAGCGCNAALYLTSMAQNDAPSQCGDHYCDANNVCGESCAEIDLQEANQHAWHSTLHSAHDNGGLGVGFGGGNGWNGPRDFTSDQYGPGASCIDTNHPFQVEVSFPIDGIGSLSAMEVKLTQTGKPCPITMRVAGYEGMDKLTAALQAGMTPIVSYWAADDMTWMDGTGADGQGPCAVDNAAACAHYVRFYNFSIADYVAPPAAPRPAPFMAATTPAPWTAAPWTPPTTTTPARAFAPVVVSPDQDVDIGGTHGSGCSDLGQDCRSSQCCKDPGMQCYQKNQWWASCKASCTPGIDVSEPVKYQTPWACTALGPRSPGTPAMQEDNVVVIRLRAEQVPPEWQEGVEVSLSVAGQMYRAKLVHVVERNGNVRLEAKLEAPLTPGNPVQAFFTTMFVFLLLGTAVAGIWHKTGSHWWMETLTTPPVVNILAAIRRALVIGWHRATIMYRMGCDTAAAAQAQVEAAANAGDPSMLCGNVNTAPSEVVPQINAASPTRRRLLPAGVTP